MPPTLLPPWFPTLYPTTSRIPTPTSLAILDKHNKLRDQLRNHICSVPGVLTDVDLELQPTHQEILQQTTFILCLLNRITARFITSGIEDIQDIVTEDLKTVEECVRFAKALRKEGPRLVRE